MFIVEHIQIRCEIFVALCFNCFHNFWVGMADIQHADTCYKVKEYISIHILDHCAFCSVHEYRSQHGNRIGNIILSYL